MRAARDRVVALTTALEESRSAYRLSRIQYEAGAIDFQTLLDAQRTLFLAEDTLAIARFERLSAIVDLMQSLGGGWVEEPSAQG